MTHDYKKRLAAAAWASVMLALMFAIPPASLATLVAFTFITIAPAALMWQFWTAPPETLSQIIQKELR